MACRETKIIRWKGEWFVYITVEREVQERNPKSVLAVDLGIRWIATTVNSNKPRISRPQSWKVSDPKRKN
jgi:transposase